MLNAVSKLKPTIIFCIFAQNMLTMEQQKKIILVAVDFNEVSLDAARQACALAKILGKRVVLLYVFHNSGFLSKIFSDEQNKLVFDNAASELKKLSDELSARYSVSVEGVVKSGSVHGQILAYCEEISARFLIIGTRSNFSEGKKAGIGAIACKIIRGANCPVITINSPVIHHEIRNIILPLDLTEETRQKVGIAIEIAQKFNSKIHVISALWSKGNKDIEYQLKAQLNQVQKVVEKAGVECFTRLVDCDESCLVPTILTYINTTPEIDLLVIMTQQEVAIVEYFMGSTAQEVIRQAEIPVLSVIPKEVGNIVVGF
jgi:nucleotide-binding universal stress UspA family protein